MNTAKIKKILLFVIVPCILFAVMNVLWWEGAKANESIISDNWILKIHIPQNYQYGLKAKCDTPWDESRLEDILDPEQGFIKGVVNYHHNQGVDPYVDGSEQKEMLIWGKGVCNSFLMDNDKVEIKSATDCHNKYDYHLDFFDNEVIKGMYMEDGSPISYSKIMTMLNINKIADVYIDIKPKPGTLHIHKQTPCYDIDFMFDEPYTETIDGFVLNSNSNINRVREDTIDIHAKREIDSVLINNDNINIVSNKRAESYDKDIIELVGSENIFDIFIIDSDHIRPASWECGWIIDQLNSGNDVDLIVYHTF